MITIRQAVEADATELSLIGQAAFLDAYAEIVPGADLVAHCGRTHSPDVYANWLADPACAIWLAETSTGAPVGYCVVTPAALPHPAQAASDLEVLRIYVLSRFHGSGVGHRLMNAAIAAARRHGAPHMVLGMLKTNAKALAFYQRQGFVITGTRTFQVGTMIMDDYILTQRLD